MILQENRLPADDSHEISCLIGYSWKSSKIWNCRLLAADNSHEISCLIGYFWKSGKIWNCRLLQIIGVSLRDIYRSPSVSGSPATEDSENVAPAKKLKKDEPSSWGKGKLGLCNCWVCYVSGMWHYKMVNVLCFSPDCDTAYYSDSERSETSQSVL